MPKWSSAVSLFALAAVLVVAMGCDFGNNPGGGGNTANISIVSSAFSPAAETVAVGTTVTWKNLDAADHTVTSDTGAFYSATLHQGDPYPHTFSTAGSYPYHCNFDGSMHATIVVQ